MSRLTACKLARMQRGLTLEGLSKETGYSPSTLGNIELGNVRTWPKIEAALADFYNIPRNILFDSWQGSDVGNLLQVLIRGSEAKKMEQVGAR